MEYPLLPVGMFESGFFPRTRKSRPEGRPFREKKIDRGCIENRGESPLIVMSQVLAGSCIKRGNYGNLRPGGRAVPFRQKVFYYIPKFPQKLHTFFSPEQMAAFRIRLQPHQSIFPDRQYRSGEWIQLPCCFPGKAESILPDFPIFSGKKKNRGGNNDADIWN